MDPMKILQMLYAELMERRRPIRRLTDYFDGDHPLAFTSEKFLEAFGGLFHSFADNWCGVVIGATEERMQVTGFRAIGEKTDAATSEESVKADDDASRIWETNELDLQSQMAHTEALAFGAAYGRAWYDKDKKAEITVESAHNAIVARHPKFRKRITAGLLVWTDEQGYEHAELMLPDRVYLFRSKSKDHAGLVMPGRAQWVAEDDPETIKGMNLDASSSMKNPLGRVPMVELLNKPRLHVSKRAGWFVHSDLTPIIPLNDGVNKMTADMFIASEFAAYPQRFVSKWEADDDEETGEPIPPDLKNGPGSVWWTEAEAQFGAFPQMDITQYCKVIEMLIQHIASISATPPHYLNSSADRLSGESLKSSETGLVAKTRRKMRTFGPAWEELMRIAGSIENIGRLSSAVRMETIWKDPETRTESEHVDALNKKITLGVPLAQLQEEAGYAPDLIKRFPAMAKQAELDGIAAQAAARIVNPPGPSAFIDVPELATV